MISKVIRSLTGGGNARATIYHDNGDVREVTRCSDGGITVVDTNSVGKQVVGDGVTGPLNILEGADRINTK